MEVARTDPRVRNVVTESVYRHILGLVFSERRLHQEPPLLASLSKISCAGERPLQGSNPTYWSRDQSRRLLWTTALAKLQERTHESSHVLLFAGFYEATGNLDLQPSAIGITSKPYTPGFALLL
jgi:hypothetical protein